MADSVSGDPVRTVLTEASRDDGWHSLLLFPFDFNVNCHVISKLRLAEIRHNMVLLIAPFPVSRRG